MTEIGHIMSEECNPFAALVVGRLFARVTAAKVSKDQYALEHAYSELWYACNAFNCLSVAIRTATHFSLAANNHLRWLRELIMADLGIDPELHSMWQWRSGSK